MPFAAPAKNQLRLLICAALSLGTLIVYAPLLHHDFLNYDDPDYITGNAHVTGGITRTNMIWAFTTGEAANWHPLTWISHMMDCEIFGLNPAGHHLMNLLFHTADTLLLFLLLQKLTGALWRSAMVAALFAWHPLHVESVAWASERKDVLSAFFWMLSLLAYKHFTQKKNLNCYFLSLFFFACGLMSKPMVVTLPFVLLLLDFWPLRRFDLLTIQRLLLEKTPFFALSLISCLVTYHVQHDAIWSTQSLSFYFRLANALMSYVRYISKIFWPTELVLIYPYPHFWPLAGIIFVAALLGLLSAIFIFQARRFPYLVLGWFWFLGTLVPAIGLVQVGVQSMADRYTYLPAIGIFILVVWGVNDLLNSRPQKIKIAGFAAGLALAGCFATTSIQLKYWQNSVTIFWHAVKVTTDNYAAEDCLGRALENIGKKDEAEKLYADAVRLEPDYPLAQFDLGMIELQQGKSAAASNHLAAAAQLSPRNPVMQFDFGIYLSQHGNSAEAATHFKAALADKTDFLQARRQLDLLSTNSSALDIKK